MNLKAKPFYLNDEDVKWIESTLKEMSLDDKVRQLFVSMAAPVGTETINHIVDATRPGGLRYMNGPKDNIKRILSDYQKASKIPLIIAANTDDGGNGAVREGTFIGSETKIAATDEEKYAYELGRVCALESSAVGCNTLFNPIVDINTNYHNPIIATRTFGNDPKKVAKFSKAFLNGAHSAGVACFCKHFPGDGVDERDQHLANSVNSLSKEEWDKSFGYVYQQMIDEGVEGIMVGHIMLPAYEKYFKGIKEGPYTPATLSKELLIDLLRNQLGFNGLTVTDASHMVGLTGRMARQDFVPLSIQAGCDMFLFYNEFDEDIEFVKDGVKRGILTLERLDEAVTRILAYKAHLGLHKEVKDISLDVIGKDEYKKISDEIAHKGISLIKEEKGVLPITNKKYKKILIIPHNSANPFNAFIGGSATKYYDRLKEDLEKEGFEVEIHTPVLEQLAKASEAEMKEVMGKLYTSKTAIATLKQKCDLVIQMANIPGNGVVQRLDFALTKGGLDIPWYVYELPVIFVSVNSPFHLIDVPQVKTYINCYDGNMNTIDALCNKLIGKESFTGVSPVDAFCGKEDTRW